MSFKTLAVTRIKPHVSTTTWSIFQRLGGKAPASSPSPAPTPEQLERRRLRSMDLTDLAKEFRTDKWGAHRYTPHYQRHLEHLRGSRFTLLEIGIGGASHEGVGGASLRMWKWFFPKAQILGLDIFDKSFVDEPRIVSYQGSQTDPAIFEEMIEDHGAPMVVIDDGSHQSTHIRETFRILFPRLPDGAVYAIEDTQTSYWPQWDGDADRHSRRTTMALVKDLIDGLNYEEFVGEYEPSYSDLNIVAVHCYHNLVFIEKGPNREGTTKDATLARVALEGLDS